jgi:hypothetical protein
MMTNQERSHTKCSSARYSADTSLWCVLGELGLRLEKERPLWTVPGGRSIGRLVLHQHEALPAEVMDELAQPRAGFGQARWSILRV